MKLAPQPVVYRGLVSGLRVSAVDGTAFIDNLPSAVTDLVTASPGVYLAEVYDSAGRAIKGVLGSVGTGETLGSELVDSWSNAGYETLTVSGSDITQAVNSDASSARAYKQIVSSVGQFLKFVIGAYTLNSGTGPIYIPCANATTLSPPTDAPHFSVAVGSYYSTAIYNNQYTGFRNVSTNGDWSASGISVKQVLTPSAQGATIVSAKGGATQNFSYKNASFAYNQTTAYTVTIKKLRGRALNLSGTATGIRFSAIDDTAFVDNLPAGILPYADGKHYLRIYDSAGKYVEGVLKAVGSGETLDSELVTNGGFASDLSNWTPGLCTLASISGGQVGNCCELTVVSGSEQSVLQSITNSNNGALFFVSAYVKSGTSGNELSWISCGSKIIQKTTAGSWSAASGYTTESAGALSYRLRKRTSTAGTMLFDEASLKQVIAPSASGCTITNTIGGTTYRFITKETGFNFNDTGNFSYQVWSLN